MTKNGTSFQKHHLLKIQGGFSLPEILIVFLTVAIIVVIALPGIMQTLQLYRLDSSVSVIGNKLMETRMTAIKRNRTAWLRLDKTARTVVIRSTNSDGATIDVAMSESFPTGMILDESDSVEIRFNSFGNSTAGSQTFTLQESNSEKRKDITVSPAGKISVGNMY
jgi:Tfp pilus assembly protein FimT